MSKNINENCNCPNTDCPRNKNCNECKAFHDGNTYYKRNPPKETEQGAE